MLDPLIIYTVTMERWGDPENHSYLLGAWGTQRAAEIAGREEQESRAGKYEPRILRLVVNDTDSVLSGFRWQRGRFYVSLLREKIKKHRTVSIYRDRLGSGKVYWMICLWWWNLSIRYTTKLKPTDAQLLAKAESELEEATRIVAAVKDIVTCVGCPENKVCRYAFDSYNTHGECLAIK